VLKTLLIVAAAVCVAVPAVAQTPLSQADRDALIKDLERSRAMFLESIADVKTEAQWTYKPAPDRWSVAECAAHIIATEAFFRDQIAGMLKTPAVQVAKQAEQDATVSKMIRDRSQRFTAPAALEPAGKVVPKAQAVKDFEATRATTIAYIRTTKDALREHASGTGPNQMTAYQMVLMLSGHTERHTAQLLEVKASAGYPKQ
jgi:hypothetical protein